MPRYKTFSSGRTDQLRVRLSKEEREAVAKLILRRGGDLTSADIVREAIAWCLRPNPDQHTCFVSPAVYLRVEVLARLLNREANQVINDCVEGVLEMIDNQDRKPPLIVAEAELRQKYDKGRRRSGP
jgi:hypothetical protein